MKDNREKAIAIAQIDNDRVIVTEWRFSPGAETGWHIHAYDYLVIPQMKGKLLLETNDANNIAELDKGKTYFKTAGVEHNVINANDYDFSFVEVELK